MKLLTIDLEEKLVSTRKATIAKALNLQQQQESLLDQANELLVNSTEDDINYLSRNGFSRAVSASRDVISSVKESKKRIESLNTNPRVFTLSEIKSVCIAYGLRFLGTEQYKGNLPADLAVHIKDALELNNNKYKRTYRTYGVNNGVPDLMIAAPKQSFELRAKPIDPLLFLKLDNGNYYLVHKWGNDLSSFRYITNLAKRNDFSIAASIVLATIILAIAIVVYFGGPWALGLFIGSITGAIFVTALFNAFDLESNKDSWNNEFTN